MRRRRKPYLDKAWRPLAGVVSPKSMFVRPTCRFWTSRLRLSMFGGASLSAPIWPGIGLIGGCRETPPPNRHGQDRVRSSGRWVWWGLAGRAPRSLRPINGRGVGGGGGPEDSPPPNCRALDIVRAGSGGNPPPGRHGLHRVWAWGRKGSSAGERSCAGRR